MRILIVEDEQIIAADLEAKLLSLGHEVVGTAVSGAEAIQLAEQLRPELVLMDIQLRGKMNGIEAARQIQPATGAQIVFLTAFAGTFLRNPEQMSQPGLCLSKPFSRYQLAAVLQAVQPTERPSEGKAKQ
jgi:CheY-like chemotaxis protein